MRRTSSSSRPATGSSGTTACAPSWEDEELRAASKCHVVTANDLVAAWGAKQLMESGPRAQAIGIMAGPATDNEVGVRYVTEQLEHAPRPTRVPHGARLADLVEERTFRR